MLCGMALFDPARHQPLDPRPWDAAAARAAVRAIAAAALRAFDGDGWPAHPLDEPPTPRTRYAMLYFGAGGVIWALRRLAELGAIDRSPRDFASYVASLAARNRATLEGWGEGEPMTRSFIMGDAGLHLLHWRFTREAPLADAVYRAVEANLDHPSREPMWGSPGTLLAAVHLAEATGEARWAALCVRTAEALWRQMEFDDAAGCWLWEQDLYGERVRYLGAAHGFAGNLHAVLRAAPLLDAQLVAGFAERALQTLQATALAEDGRLNWPSFLPWPADRLPLVQDCHGAPGIVCRLAGAPRDARWDALLDAAGELVWAAGPLVKGASLCHGTAGNGWALLALYRRSGQARWLDRARAFAMHAIAQVERDRARYGGYRWSLWTGDPGVALFLWNCLDGGDARLPLLDVF